MRKKSSVRKRPGRPKAEVTKAMCRAVERLAGRGLTMAQIAESLRIGERTLYTHQAENPQLQQSIKRGRAKGLADIANALYRAAKSGNVTAQIFYLKNRDPDNWRDVSHLKHDDVGRRALERFTREDAVRIAENVLKQAEAEATLDPMRGTIDDEPAGSA